jgi:hypothetical protein
MPSKSGDSITNPTFTNVMSIQSTVTYQEVPSGRQNVRRFMAVSSVNEPLSIKSWMTLIASQSESGIKTAMDLSTVISSSDYESILFETMGTSWSASDSTPFEFVMVNQPSLKSFAEGSPDRFAFEEHFNQCLNHSTNRKKSSGGKDVNVPTVCSFDNLGGDASLVSPLPQKNISDVSYSHIAVFVRNAPKSQIAEFWALGAAQYLDALQTSGGKRWFSTNGMGVAWLHLRLDTRPKYYSYDPFT